MAQQQLKMKTTETCKALEMLEKCSVIELDGYLIHNWYLDTLDCDDDEMVFECSYNDEEGLITNFRFLKKDIITADIHNNCITMNDDTGEKAEISCFVLNPYCG